MNKTTTVQEKHLLKDELALPREIAEKCMLAAIANGYELDSDPAGDSCRVICTDINYATVWHADDDLAWIQACIDHNLVDIPTSALTESFVFLENYYACQDDEVFPELTNIEKITSIMEYSKFGALAQLFVMDAVGKFSNMVANTPIEELESMRNGLISPEGWRGVAVEIAEKLRS